MQRPALTSTAIMLDWAFYLVVVSFFVALSGTMLYVAYPSIVLLFTGAGDSTHVNYVRNFVELLYFITNSMVAVIAIIAIRFAQKQVIHAQTQNEITSGQTAVSITIAQAGVYMRLVENISSSGMANGLDFYKKIFDGYHASALAIPLIEYAQDEIGKFTPDDMKRLIEFLTFIEDVGLMTRRGYLYMDDVYFLLEGPLKNFGDVFMGYLEYRRENSYNKRMCEHAIWLLKTIRTYHPKTQLPPEPS